MCPLLNKVVKSDDELTVNITSMIDVIFILLIFFMVSTQFKKSSLPLELPQTSQSSSSTEDKGEKVLSVNADRIFLDGEEVLSEELESRLTILSAQNSDVSFSIECDRAVEFERFMFILTSLENAGITKIGIIHETLDD